MAERSNDLDRIGGNVRKMIDLGAPAGEIDQYLGTEGWTPQEFRSANMQQHVDLGREVGAVGAGLHRGFANTLGLPVDLMNTAFRAAQHATPIGEQEGVIPGPGQVVGAIARLLPEASDNPVGGSSWIKDRFGDVGVDIDRQAQTSTGRIVARAGEELGGMAVPMAGAMAIPARELSATGNAVREALAGTGTMDRVGQAVVSAGAGAGAGVAQEAAPNSQWAELAGGLAGGLATGAGLGALQAGVSVAAPFLSQGARESAAGAALRRFSANPDALETNLATAPREIVPGSKLTTAQAVRDPGLAILERTIRDESPPNAGVFARRDAERAGAQRAAIDAQAPAGPGAPDVAAMARDRLERFQAASGARTDRMQGAVDQQAAALGGDAAPDTYGRTIREELASGRQSAKGYEQQLWQRLQDRPDLALEVSGTRDAAQKMLGEIGPYAAAPEGDASSILGLAADLPDVLRYRDLQQLRSRIVQAQDAFTRNGNAVDARRLSGILTGIDDDLARAAGGDAAALPSAPQLPGLPAPSDRPMPPAGPSASMALQTETVGPLPYRWDVVEADSLKPASGAMQPRDRSRATSDAQVSKIASTLNPERLGVSAELGSGAPVVMPDGTIADGNGRVAAITRAYANQGPQAEAYRQWLAQQGVDVAGMKAPVLVRRPTADLTPDQWQAVAREANARKGMGYSASELAALDADRLSPDLLDLYRGGPLDAADNADLVRGFAKRLDGADLNGFATADRGLSVDGLRRLQTAFVQRAYGNADLVRSLAEAGDDNIRALGRALTDAAPSVARLKAAVERGQVGADLDPARGVTEAVQLVQRARSKGIPLGDLLRQADAFNAPSPFATEFLAAAYGPELARVSPSRASAMLRAYADEALQAGASDQMFGAASPVDILRSAGKRAAGVEDDAASAAPAAPVPQAPAGGGGGKGILPPDELQPNFGPDEAALYRQARAATAERKGTYERGAVGDVLQQGGFRSTDGPYLRPDETVAGRFFNAGRTSRTDVQQFLAAAGDREKAVQALKEYAAGDLKRAATGADGAIDPAKWRKWMDQHVAALRPFPELMRQMDSVGKAQSLVATVGRQADDAVRAFEASPAGKLVGDRDPDRAFAQILQGGNVTAGLRQLVRLAKGDAGQVRRAAVDYLLRSIENPGSVDAAGEVGLSTAKMARTVDKLAGPLQESGLFGADHVSALRKVVEDMRRGVYAQNAGRAVGSNTYQNLSAASVLGQIGLGRLAESTLFASTVGRPVAFLLRIPDQEVRRLIADAMLDPNFALQLARRATPDRMEWVARSLNRRLTATAAGATAQAASPRDQQPTEQR